MSRQGYETRRTLIEAERDLDFPAIIWPATGGSNYVCVPSKSVAQTIMAALGGGFTSVGTVAFFVRVELFADQTTGVVTQIPAANQTMIGPDGSTLRIVSVNTTADGVAMFLDCVDANYNA